MSSEHPTHYQLLADYHADAAKAARALEGALHRKAEAEKEIASARRAITSSQELIDQWYREQNPDDLPKKGPKAASAKAATA